MSLVQMAGSAYLGAKLLKYICQSFSPSCSTRPQITQSLINDQDITFQGTIFRSSYDVEVFLCPSFKVSIAYISHLQEHILVLCQKHASSDASNRCYYCIWEVIVYLCC